MREPITPKQIEGATWRVVANRVQSHQTGQGRHLGILFDLRSIVAQGRRQRPRSPMLTAWLDLGDAVAQSVDGSVLIGVIDRLRRVDPAAEEFVLALLGAEVIQ